MKTKQEARLSYYAGIRKAMLTHIDTTEKSIRKLDNLSDAAKDRLVAVVHKRHLKLMKQIDEDMDKEVKASKAAVTF